MVVATKSLFLVVRYEELTSDVECVVDHLVGDPAFLFGHSFGAR